MRRVRRVSAYVCTSCFSMFPTSAQAKTHVKEKHPAKPAKSAKKRRGPTQTGAILDAIGKGAKSAQQVSKKTRIPLERVHSLLSYHRRRGNVKGMSGDLRLVK